MIAVALLLLALQSGGGDIPVHGRVLRVVGRDTLAVARATVFLHRVTPAVQGVIDSTTSDAAGRYRFRARADSGAVLLVSARHEGLEYFAPPIAPERATAGATFDIEVADLDAAAPVGIAARHLIVGGPAADGTRDVVDLVIVRNASGRTRAMPDSTIPVWQLALPAHAANVRLGDADFAADAFDLHGDTLFLHAPIPPGERQLFLEYQIVPATRIFRVPLDQPIEALSLLAEEDALTLTGPLTRTDVQEMEGRRFVRWTGTSATPAVLVLTLPGGGGAPPWLLAALVGGFALLLVGVGVRLALLRRG